MKDVVLAGFRGALQSLESALNVMPLSRWNESVFRYFFSRSLAIAQQDVEQFVECGKIDLVLTHGPFRAFVEFKFYTHPPRFDPYGRGRRGFKGRPSRQNLGEFQYCIDQLYDREVVTGLSKYVVLVDVDPVDEARPDHRYSTYYDEYQHSRKNVPIRLIEASTPFNAGGEIVQAKLYEIGAPPTRRGTGRLFR